MRFNTVPENIEVFENPDTNIMFYKKYELDNSGEIIGFYKPIVNNFGYLHHSIRDGMPFVILHKTN